MTDWFTVEKIDSDTFAISEYKHWEETHCYLLLGKEQAVLIDTGLGVANIKEVTDRLTSLPILTAITHVHWDHIGGCGYYDSIAVHEAERDWLAAKFPLPLRAVKENLMRGGCDFPPDFRPDSYQLFQGTPQKILRDGDCLDAGGRRLTVLHTPGHSPGHCCFYEPERGYLYSGDLIYSGCLDAFYPTTDPAAFFQSVKRVNALEVRRVLPGHHRLDLPDDLIDQTEKGFRQLADRGLLKQGNGIFDFGAFQIHV